MALLRLVADGKVLVVAVYSDNSDGHLFTADAYREYKLQMSTGDFHTHQIEILEIDELADDVITIETLWGAE